MNEDEIIEQIARRWFWRPGSDPRLTPELWERQPDDIKQIFLTSARKFWENPGAAGRRNADLLHRLDAMLVDYRRGIDAKAS